MWLVGLGAEVLRVEPPDGDPTRIYPPFAGDIEDRERSVFHLHFNRGKKSIVLDTNNAEDAHTLGLPHQWPEPDSVALHYLALSVAM